MTRRPPSGMRPMRFDLRPTKVVKWLMIVNAGIWFLASVLVNFMESRPAFDALQVLDLAPTDVIPGLEIWRPITYMWLHMLGSLEHILMNMLGLFFLGPPLERRWGQRTFLRFYLLVGVLAGLFTVIVGLIAPGWFSNPVIGASGAILGIVAAFSLVMPEMEILLFFVLPVKARYLIWIAVGFDLLFFFANNPATQRIAIHTHMGGVLAAWLLITGNWRPRVAISRFRLWTRRRKQKKARPKRPGFRVLPGGKDDDDRYLH